jgi:hypothetical protein
MGKTINRWMVTLSALLMALVVLLSAVGLDHAEAKKRNRLNVVQCPTGGSSYECVGTSAKDRLIGRDDTYDNIQGAEGNDTYDGKGSCDSWRDGSLTSNDRYLVSVKDFCNVGISTLSIEDNGGSKDLLDLSNFYKSTDFGYFEGYKILHMDGPGVNDVVIYNFFTTDSVDYFKFKDKTLTAQQVKEMSVDE